MNDEVSIEENTQAKLSLPRHVAIIMDGNGRWALQRNQPRFMGHREAIKAVTKAVEIAAKREIEVLSLFAFSSENWSRPQEEVSYLLRLFLKVLHDQVEKLNENNIYLRVIGDLSKFPEKLQQAIADAEYQTKKNTGLKLVVAANYGGHWDILQAVKKVAMDVASQSIQIQNLDESLFSQYLSMSDLPNPDLLIRTSGEQRLSNFFLWQLAYTELYFSEVLWPDFNEEAFDQALKAYSKRHRRFGAIKKQGDKLSA